MNHNPGISDVSASWRQSLSLPSPLSAVLGDLQSPHPLSLSWLLYGRMLFGKDVPNIYQNIIGGTTFAHYLEQQMPMPGMGYAEFAERHFAAIQLQVQQQLGEKHYVSLLAACAQHAPELKHLLETKTIVGAQLAYAYSTMFGPLGASIGYCTRTKSPYLQVSLGYDF